EPETMALRDFIMAHQAKGVVFWQAKTTGGLSSPGACGVTPQVSGTLARLYGNAADYQVADFENLTNTILNGDSTNWLDAQGIPAITVLLPEYNSLDEQDWEDNLTAVLAVLDELGN
ncbi:MAG: hypothetical protein KC419_18080, partial [Anaerolineales bacterium]|nr:hypothetical protein [Anaerolineales bacterium]